MDGPFYKHDLYYCDPDKNVKCTKEGCHYRPMARADCCLTTNREFAKTDADGNPRLYLSVEDQNRIPPHLWPTEQPEGNS